MHSFLVSCFFVAIYAIWIIGDASTETTNEGLTEEFNETCGLRNRTRDQLVYRCQIKAINETGSNFFCGESLTPKQYKKLTTFRPIKLNSTNSIQGLAATVESEFYEMSKFVYNFYLIFNTSCTFSPKTPNQTHSVRFQQRKSIEKRFLALMKNTKRLGRKIGKYNTMAQRKEWDMQEHVFLRTQCLADLKEVDKN